MYNYKYCSWSMWVGLLCVILFCFCFYQCCIIHYLGGGVYACLNNNCIFFNWILSNNWLFLSGWVKWYVVLWYLLSHHSLLTLSRVCTLLRSLGPERYLFLRPGKFWKNGIFEPRSWKVWEFPDNCQKQVCRRGGGLSLIHIWRCRRITGCRSRWSPYH